MTSSFYTGPSYMNGGAFTIYSGSRRQRGGGFMGSIRSMMAPVGRNVLKGMKSIAKNKAIQKVAKVAAQKGAEILTGVAVDALQGQNIGDSFGARTRQVALNTLTGNASANEPRPKKRKVTVKAAYINSNKKLKQKKVSVRKKKLTRGKKRLSRAELNRKELF